MSRQGDCWDIFITVYEFLRWWEALVHSELPT